MCAELHEKCAAAQMLIRPANVLGVSCTARPARRSQSGAAVAAEELQATTGDVQPP